MGESVHRPPQKESLAQSHYVQLSRAPCLSVCLIFIISLEGRQRHREYCRSIDSLLSLSLSLVLSLALRSSEMYAGYNNAYLLLRPFVDLASLFKINKNKIQFRRFDLPSFPVLPFFTIFGHSPAPCLNYISQQTAVVPLLSQMDYSLPTERATSLRRGLRGDCAILNQSEHLEN